MELVKTTLQNLSSIVGELKVACKGCAKCVSYAEAVKAGWLADRSRGNTDPDYFCNAKCHDHPSVLRVTRTRSKAAAEPVVPERRIRRTRQ